MSLFEKVVASLHLSQEEDLVFHGQQVDIGSPNIYGGHVLAQALRAARLCVDPEKGFILCTVIFCTPAVTVSRWCIRWSRSNKEEVLMSCVW
ncbi:MAG: hypothetical protein IPJ54_02405 [Saprospiraceae bacterium]|nr:hypothetical protein [Saprospiraceae bacterium]